MPGVTGKCDCAHRPLSGRLLCCVPHALAYAMNDGGRQLQQPRLRGALGAHVDRDAAIAGEGIGQYFEVLAIDSDPLRRRVAELLDLGANLGGRETVMVGDHRILASGRRKQQTPLLERLDSFPRGSAVIEDTAGKPYLHNDIQANMDLPLRLPGFLLSSE